jgi:hypothetical protein
MIWLTPTALFALAAVAAPILIHILVQRRAERFSFPTLRFIAPTRLAAVRRHLLEDAALLAVRMAIFAAAVAALAGPLLVTAARHRAWDQRIVRATVVASDVARAFPASAGTTSEPASARLAEAAETRRRQARDHGPGTVAPYLEKTFDAASLADGIRRAVAWLDTAPPARRELVVVSPLAIGSLTAADLAPVPVNVGVRFERRGALPPARSVDGVSILTAAGVVRQRVTLSGPQTIVRDTRVDEQVSWPIDVRTAPASQPAIAAAIAAVQAERVSLPPANRRARLVVLDVARASPPNVAQVPSSNVAQGFSPAIDDAAPIREAWMADAIARVAADRELEAVASNVAAGISDPRYAAAPWHAVVRAADGRPLAVAAGSAAPLIFVSGANPENLVTALLVRAVVNSLADPPNLQAAEVVPIADRVLSEWSRPAPPVTAPRVDTVAEDDRRWLWLTTVVLLAVETWMRRARTTAAREDSPETARVA